MNYIKLLQKYYKNYVFIIYIFIIFKASKKIFCKNFLNLG
jgi:hypothetical protein